MTTTPSSRRRGPATVLLPGLLLLGALAGGLSACGDDPAPQVASLPPAATSSDAAPDGPTGGSGSGAADPSDAAGGSSGSGGARPQYRLDDTDARRTALINAWSQCLLDHGAERGGRQLPAGAAGSGTSDLIVVADPVPPAASAACQDLLPDMPPEVEAATNPQFHEQSLAYVACMKEQGLWVQLLNDHNLDWTYQEGHPAPTDSAEIEHACLLQAFGSK